jgi:hypothetical protein
MKNTFTFVSLLIIKHQKFFIMSTLNVAKTNVASTSKELSNVAKPKQKTKAIIYQSNDIAKNEYSFSQFVNKIKKDRNDCYISLAFCKLCERETKRPILSLKEIPYPVLVNHFLPVFNAAKKFPLKTDKCTWYSVSLFLSYVANMEENDFNEVLNFGLKHSPKK